MERNLRGRVQELANKPTLQQPRAAPALRLLSQRESCTRTQHQDDGPVAYRSALSLRVPSLAAPPTAVAQGEPVHKISEAHDPAPLSRKKIEAYYAICTHFWRLVIIDQFYLGRRCSSPLHLRTDRKFRRACSYYGCLNKRRQRVTVTKARQRQSATT